MAENPEQAAAAVDPVAHACAAWLSAHTTLGPHHELTLAALRALAPARWSPAATTLDQHISNRAWGGAYPF